MLERVANPEEQVEKRKQAPKDTTEPLNHSTPEANPTSGLLNKPLCFNRFEACRQPKCPDTENFKRSALISSNFMAS